MSEKFIPNGDQDFAAMAWKFERTIAREPARFGISQEDSDLLSANVQKFRDALQVARKGGARSQVATRLKDEARGEAERIIRRIAHLIRANDKLDPVAKFMVNIPDRTRKAKQLTCPNEAPRLRFVRASHEQGVVPQHELEFSAREYGKSRPKGAVRLELFIDLIPPDEPIPTHPGANHGSRPWYLRSYTRSPIRLTPPMAKVPMRIVYWARWADSTGNVGPFSATAAAWIEGGNYLPRLNPFQGNREPIKILDQARAADWPDRDPIYRTALLEAQDESYTKHVMPALPEMTAKEIRQLEGPEMRGEQERAEEVA
jgi:hypothetical protein